MGKSTGDDDTEIDAQLIAVSRYIDRRLGRFFTKDAVALTREFSARGHLTMSPDRTYVDLIGVDDMAAAPTAVVVDADDDGVFETALLSADYELLPLNALRGPEPEPYRQIRLRRGTGATYSSWGEHWRVRVTAVWGWPAVPEAISQATCQLVAILRLESPRATTQMSAGFDTVLGTSRQGQDIIEKLQAVYAKRWVFA